jgi:hypothetical protein
MAKKRRMAPYVAVGALSEFLDRIKSINLPSEITTSALEKIGISKSNALALVSALRFLDLVKDDGTPTDKLRSLQASGDEFKANLESVVRSAYTDLFSLLDPTKDDREHLRNYFARAYSPATADKATSLFLDVCDEAGIQTAAGNLGRRNSEPKKSPVINFIKKDPLPPGGSFPRLQYHQNGSGPHFEVKIDSKDFASMQPDQIKAFFEGLNMVVKQENKEKTEP